MKKISRLFLFVFIGIGFFSCSNEELVEQPTTSLNAKKLEFIYDGVTYSSLYTVNKDSIMVIEDKKVANLYEKLSNLPELATYVHENGIEEYFDNAEMVMASIQNSNKQVDSQLRMSGNYEVGANLKLYTKANFEDQVYEGTYSLTNSVNVVTFRILVPFPSTYGYNPYNFNDKIVSVTANASIWSSLGGPFGTSVKCKRCVLFFYEGFDYKGKSLVLQTPEYPVLPFKVANLANYKMVNGGLFNHSKGWDTNVSSVRVEFVM